MGNATPVKLLLTTPRGVSRDYERCFHSLKAPTTRRDVTSGASPAEMEIVISPKAAAVTGVAQNPNTGNSMPGGW